VLIENKPSDFFVAASLKLSAHTMAHTIRCVLPSYGWPKFVLRG